VSAALSPRLRAALVAGVLLLAGALAAVGLRLDNDLARFMPVPEQADARLLVGELGRGPGARLLVLAIDAPTPERAAALSHALAAALAEVPGIERVANGRFDEVEALQALLPLRFSHSPAMATARFDAEGLAEVLAERLADLGGLGGEAFDLLLAHDPHLLTLDLVQTWQPRSEPARVDGAWMAADGRALLLVETAAAGFDPAAQAGAIAAVREAFAALPEAGGAGLVLSGPGSFSARMGETVRREASLLGALAGVGTLVLLLLAYRTPRFVLAAALPLACAAAVGLVALRLVFGDVHGITLAFAFTLIGVAQDYPVHLLSHSHPGQPPAVAARAIWPALRLGVASTVLAYLTLFTARAEGLAQLAVFTVTGLLTAAAVTRWLLPALLARGGRDVARGRLLAALARRLGGLRDARAGLAAVVVFGLLLAAALLSQQQRSWWNDDLASLTPLPPAWLAEDAALRAELATPDARHLLVLEGGDDEAVLRLSEALQPRLDALVAAGALADHGLPSRWQPSAAVQAWRLARLPAPETLRAALADAAEWTGFDPRFFEPMVADVRAARSAEGAATRAAAQADSPAGSRVAAAMRRLDERSLALVELSGIADLAALREAIADQPQARLVDLKATAQSLVVAFRDRVLTGLVLAALALLALLALAVGPARTLRVLPPVLLAVAATVAVLRLLGVELTLFHLVALMLSAGLGLDYALFFGHAGARDEADRTLHAVLVSVASTALVFGLLASSSIPVLRALGLTVAVGVASQFAFALLLSRGARPEPAHA